MRDDLPMLIAAGVMTSLLLYSGISEAAADHSETGNTVKQMMNEQWKQEQLTAAVEPEKVAPVQQPEPETDWQAEIIPCYTHGIDYITIDEFNLLCRVVQSEASIEPIDCQIAVCETILNRLAMGGFGDSITEVVYKPYAYSTAWNGEPTESVMQAVTFALEKQTYPANMVYFRTGHFHKFGTPYKQISRTYFSLAE